jgi:hypothetical protein
MGVGCDDHGERYFKDLASAKQQGMIEKGWIPQYSPSNATNIRFIYDLDAGSVYGSFVSDDLSAFREYCSPPATPFRVPYSLQRLSTSDFKDVRTSADLDRFGYEMFVCESSNYKIIARKSDKKVFYWSARN